MALQDHFKWIKKSEEIEKEKDKDEGPKADFRFKEGETIKINMKITVSISFLLEEREFYISLFIYLCQY